MGDLLAELDAPYLRAWQNGVPALPDALVADGDQITVAALPEEAITLGTAVLTTLGIIATSAPVAATATTAAVSAIAATAATLSGATWWAAFGIGLVIQSAILGGLGALASLLVEPPEQPDAPDSGTYNRAGMLSTRAEGQIIPVPQGRIKVPGHIIYQRYHHVGGNSTRAGYSVSTGSLRCLTVVALGEGPLRSIAGQVKDVDCAWFSQQDNLTRNYHPFLKTPAAGDFHTTIGKETLTQKNAFEFVVPSTGLAFTPVVSLITLNLFRIGDLTGKKLKVTVQNSVAYGHGHPEWHIPDGADIFRPVEVDAQQAFLARSEAAGWMAATRISVRIPDVELTPGIYYLVLEGDWAIDGANYLGLMSHATGQEQRAFYYDPGTPTGWWCPGQKWPPANADVRGCAELWRGSGIKVNDNDIGNFTASGHLSIRLGRSEQRALPGITEVTRQTDVHGALVFGKVLTARTQLPVDAVSLVVSFPQGWYKTSTSHPQNTAGLPLDVRIRAVGQDTWPISFRENPPPFVAAPGQAHTIRVDFPLGAANPHGALRGQQVEIEMTAVTHPGSDRIKTVAEWSLIQEIVDAQAPTWPYTALLAIDTDIATQGGALQSVTAVVESKGGWVLDNSGTTRVYQYSTNPAWRCLDWLLNVRCGGGAKLTLDDIDIDSFEEWADYCDELVPDGKGGMAKRWEIGLNIDTERAHWEWAKVFALASQTKLLRAGNKIRAKPDRATGAIVQLFSMGNIIEDTFQIEFFGHKRRPNHIYVDFLDEELDWAWNSAADHDDAVRGSDPPFTEHREIPGVTRMFRAKNLARYYTALSRNANTAISFEASADAVALEPGDVFGFQHDMPWRSVGGRLSANSAATTIYLDREVTLEVGATYKVSVRTKGTGQFVVQERTVTSVPGVYGVGDPIATTPSWTDADWPLEGDVYAFGEETETEVHVRLYEAVTVEWTRDFRKCVRAINYDPSTYTAPTERLEAPGIYGPALHPTTPATIPPAPRNLRLHAVYGPQSPSQQTIEAMWEKATWLWPYDCYVWLRTESLGERTYARIGRTSETTFVVPRRLTAGHRYGLAVTPIAAGTEAHHAPESTHAAQATIVLRWILQPGPPVTGF
ncbi:MAG: hypothetical protein JXQ29_18595 [Planctomycetes bacterium]|nr:hypothetical protein [Planctomycetota bacterium]